MFEKISVNETKNYGDKNGYPFNERQYVEYYIINCIKICEENLNTSIYSSDLLTDKYLGKYFVELMIVAKEQMEPSMESNTNKCDKLNLIERSLLFMELDAIDARINFSSIIKPINWKSMRNSFVTLLFNIRTGVKEKEINKVKIKIKEDGTLIDCIFSYGKPYKSVGTFDPDKVCEKFFYYKRWAGELYSMSNKLILSTADYTQICNNILLKYEGNNESLASSNASMADTKGEHNYIKKGYVELLEEGRVYKTNGQYQKAKEVYIEAVKIDNTMPTAYYNLGKLLYIMGEYEASARAYRASVERGIIGLMESSNIGGASLQISSFYVNLGHSLLDEKYALDNNYKVVIQRYKKGVTQAGFRANSKIKNEEKYEKMCAIAGKEYLKDLF